MSQVGGPLARCRAEGHECRCSSTAGTDWRFSGFVPSTYTALSGLGDFDHVGVTVRNKQDAMEGVWSYVGLYLYFGVREHDIRRS